MIGPWLDGIYKVFAQRLVRRVTAWETRNVNVPFHWSRFTPQLRAAWVDEIGGSERSSTEPGSPSLTSPFGSLVVSEGEGDGVILPYG